MNVIPTDLLEIYENNRGGILCYKLCDDDLLYLTQLWVNSNADNREKTDFLIEWFCGDLCVEKYIDLIIKHSS